MRTLGLTGGIGTGKSTVARMFAALGAVVLDADAVVRELQAPGSPLLAQIRAEFGPEVLTETGALNREALATVVFRDAAARARLNALVHPPVRNELSRRAREAHRSSAACVVIEVPLLFESLVASTSAEAARANNSSTALEFDAVVLVYAPEAEQIRRLMERSGLSREEALRRVRAQLPIEEKRARADYVIDNSGSLADTKHQVQALYEELLR